MGERVVDVSLGQERLEQLLSGLLVVEAYQGDIGRWIGLQDMGAMLIPFRKPE
jgi:hypothetical protein